LASTALTSSVLAQAAADAASLFASGASGALLDAPALHAEPAGGGGSRWQRGSLRPSDYATPIETQEERILFMRVLGSKAAPRDTDGWHRFAEHYNAAVAAETERLPRGADPVVRPKTADQLQVYANKLKDDLQQGNAAAPNAAAAAENAALRERVLASGRGTPHAGAQPPPAVTAPPAATPTPMWLPQAPDVVPPGGRNAARYKGCCGWPSTRHPLKREDCPNQLHIRDGYPTAGVLPGGRVWTSADVAAAAAAAAAAKRQRTS
jgi:hypothetical protein